jgi:hypothetical protein
MKVICIDNRYNDMPQEDNELLLTVGKTYDVIDEASLGLVITNDEGVNHFYARELFKLLTEVRDEKIDKLLE